MDERLDNNRETTKSHGRSLFLVEFGKSLADYYEIKKKAPVAIISSQIHSDGSKIEPDV